MISSKNRRSCRDAHQAQRFLEGPLRRRPAAVRMRQGPEVVAEYGGFPSISPGARASRADLSGLPVLAPERRTSSPCIAAEGVLSTNCLGVFRCVRRLPGNGLGVLVQ
jgi:hypothetical protein